MTDLPLEMLLTKPASKGHYTPDEDPDYAEAFLLHRYSISYAPSVSSALYGDRQTRQNPSLLVMANPCTPSAPSGSAKQFRASVSLHFSPLPYSDAEAAGIKTGKRHVKVYRRSQATKMNFFKEAPRYDIVHIASHAFIDSKFDDFSGLALAATDDSTDDGLLMGYELSGMKMRADLVVLSACHTAGGTVAEGEGILGLPRLFLKSGARSVLMTLWKVDDRFTATLMPEFYHRLLEGKKPKAESLCEAKRAMLARAGGNSAPFYAHPFYWASFVLYGDPGLQPSHDGRRGLVVAAVWTAALGLMVLAARFFYLNRLHDRGIRRKRQIGNMKNR
jgi:CHAT domain-containing protein